MKLFTYLIGVFVISTMSASLMYAMDEAGSSFCDNVIDIPYDECKALEDLYISTDGANWNYNTNWFQNNEACTWHGISCGPIGQPHTNVILIYLQFNNLNGTIPDSIGNFSKILSLDLHANQLHGSIPSSIGNLKTLTFLTLGENKLSGIIPPSLGNLTNLEQFGLYETNLEGNIPSSLGNLTKMDTLYLHSNKLSGVIPSSFGGLKKLQTLYIENNNLGGQIPSSLGNLTGLYILRMHNNHFCGQIPESLMNTSIGHFTVTNNNLITGGYSQVMESWLNKFLYGGRGPQNSTQCGQPPTTTNTGISCSMNVIYGGGVPGTIFIKTNVYSGGLTGTLPTGYNFGTTATIRGLNTYIPVLLGINGNGIYNGLGIGSYTITGSITSNTGAIIACASAGVTITSGSTTSGESIDSCKPEAIVYGTGPTNIGIKVIPYSNGIPTTLPARYSYNNIGRLQVLPVGSNFAFAIDTVTGWGIAKNVNKGSYAVRTKIIKPNGSFLTCIDTNINVQ